MIPRKRPSTSIVLAALLVLALAAPAIGAPLVMRSDRSDNTFYFTYEPTSGEVTDPSSSARFVRKDPVTFLLYVTEAPEDADQSEQLRARFTFELNKSQVVRYRGTFTVEVRNSSGAAIYTDDVERRVVLKPVRGERKKVFTIGFDLPTGSYEAVALFNAS